jgi:hypothetical protein
VIRLDAATVLLQWSTGGLFFLWLTTRRREVGIGYGWLLRSIYAVVAIGAAFAGRRWQPVAVLAVARTVVGATFLGAVTDAMLLGHWYLVQPGLGRGPVRELVTAVILVWPVEVAVLLWPPGMVSVLKGTIDDGWHGTLGWFWVGCALGTIALGFLTRAALTEKSYSAVMAATGMLYLVARAILAG